MHEFQKELDQITQGLQNKSPTLKTNNFNYQASTLRKMILNNPNQQHPIMNSFKPGTVRKIKTFAPVKTFGKNKADFRPPPKNKKAQLPPSNHRRENSEYTWSSHNKENIGLNTQKKIQQPVDNVYSADRNTEPQNCFKLYNQNEYFKKYYDETQNDKKEKTLKKERTAFQINEELFPIPPEYDLENLLSQELICSEKMKTPKLENKFNTTTTTVKRIIKSSAEKEQDIRDQNKAKKMFDDEDYVNKNDKSLTLIYNKESVIDWEENKVKTEENTSFGKKTPIKKKSHSKSNISNLNISPIYPKKACELTNSVISINEMQAFGVETEIDKICETVPTPTLCTALPMLEEQNPIYPKIEESKDLGKRKITPRRMRQIDQKKRKSNPRSSVNSEKHLNQFCETKDQSEKLTLPKILENLRISQFIEIFKKEQIELEDFFLLIREDLIELGLPIGARNRILGFQNYFKSTNNNQIEKDLNSDLIYHILSSMYNNKFITVIQSQAI